LLKLILATQAALLMTSEDRKNESKIKVRRQYFEEQQAH